MDKKAKIWTGPLCLSQRIIAGLIIISVPFVATSCGVLKDLDVGENGSGLVVSGALIDSFDQPVINAQVTLSKATTVSVTSLHPLAASDVAATATTDKTGSFLLSNVSMGVYTLLAVDSKGNSALKSIHVQKENVQTGALVLKTSGAVAGTIKLSDATSHEGVLVFMAGTSFAAYTASNGTFAMSNVAEGTYTLYAQKSGYTSASTANVTVVTQATTNITVLTLQAASSNGGSLSLPVPANVYIQTGNVAITVNWDAASDSRVTGYKVYKGGFDSYSTVYVTVNHYALSLNNYEADYYRVTAVDSNGNESVFSNMVYGSPVYPYDVAVYDLDIPPGYYVNSIKSLPLGGYVVEASLSSIGIRVIYTDSGILVAKIPGAYGSLLGGVDPSSNIYILSNDSNSSTTIDIFNCSGTKISTWPIQGYRYTYMAIDSQSNVYLGYSTDGNTGGGVHKYNSNHVYQYEIITTYVHLVTDPANNLYLSRSSVFKKFSDSGKELISTTLPLGASGGSTRMLRGENGNFYFFYMGNPHVVDIFDTYLNKIKTIDLGLTYLWGIEGAIDWNGTLFYYFNATDRKIHKATKIE